MANSRYPEDLQLPQPGGKDTPQNIYSPSKSPAKQPMSATNLQRPKANERAYTNPDIVIAMNIQL